MKSFFKIFVTLAIALLFLAGGTFAYILSFYLQNETTRHDCVVVFGAAVWPGGNPSHALRDRTQAAIDAYERGQVSCLVFSGADSAYGKHEVDVMLDIAYEREVALEDVELDYEGHNTKHTIQNLDPERSYLLVSNDFHLARINLLATQQDGLHFEVQGSNYLSGRYIREPFFIFREIIAFWYYVFFV